MTHAKDCMIQDKTLSCKDVNWLPMRTGVMPRASLVLIISFILWLPRLAPQNTDLRGENSLKLWTAT